MLFRNTDINTKRNAFFFFFFFLRKGKWLPLGKKNCGGGQGMAVFLKALGIT